SRITAGVIQPPQTLSRGNVRLSRMMVSMPAFCNCLAQEEPAGPPPTIRTWQESIEIPFPSRGLQHKGKRESKEFAHIESLRIQLETVAVVQHESLRLSQRDRVATPERILAQTMRLCDRRLAHNVPASVRGSLHNVVAGSRHQARYSSVA